MNRDQPKPTSNSKLKDLKCDSFLPDDKQIATRYIQWKCLMDKYDKLVKNDDDDEDGGMPIDDVLDMYHVGETAKDKQPLIKEEALECSDDDDFASNETSGDDVILQQQVTSALKQRFAEWKTNGLEQIFDSNFSFSVDYVQKWLEECKLGTGQQVSQERETRFTEYNGKTQMDVTRRENVSLLNETERKQLTTEHSSNYEYCDNEQRRVVVHQVAKTTISSYLTVDPNATNGDRARTVLTLPLDSFFGNITSFTPFKMPAAIEQLRKADQGKPENNSSMNGGTGTLINLMKSSLKLVPKSRVKDELNKKPRRPAPRVRFKPVRKERTYRKLCDTSSSLERSSSPSKSSHSSISSDEDTDSKEAYKSQNPDKTIKTIQSKPHPTKKNKQFILSSSTNAKSSDFSSASSCNSFEKTNGKNVSSRNDTGLKKNPSSPNQSDTINKSKQQYPMPSNYRQMLSVNGRCRYKTDGTVIYRPKPTHQGLMRNADKILIKTQDLDLTGIKCQLRRKKFDNFYRRTHPNSVLVYYMSDSDAEVSQDVIRVDSAGAGPSDDEEDDPILSFKPELCILTFFNNEAQPS